MGCQVTLLIFAFGLAVACGALCRDVSGTWQNELGSTLILNVGESNRISGEFYTAVERNPGDAALASNITGLFSKQKEGSLLAFTVIFNHGSSLTSWVGQCLVCDDREVLYTTYILRKHVSDPLEKWTSITVNQNAFWRYQDSSTSEYPSSTKTRTVVSVNHSGGLDLTGKWESQDGSEPHLEIFRSNSSVLEGKFSTMDVIGRKDGNDTFTAVNVMTTKDQTIRSLIGYIYDFSSTPQILEMTGFAHEFSSDCQRPRINVKFEAQNFVRMAAKSEKLLKKSDTFIDKIRNFFSSMF